MSAVQRIESFTSHRASPYATVREAAEYTRLSERTVRRAVASGQLPANRVGSRMLLQYTSLDAFVSGSRPALPASAG